LSTASVVQDLVDAGAKVNVASAQFFTPLLIASAHGHLDAVKLLAANKANINGALQQEVKEAKKEELKKTEDESRDENTGVGQNGEVEEDKKGETSHDFDNERPATPLMYACSLGHEEIVNYLISKGASLNIKNKGGSSAIMEAASFGSLSIFKSLIEAGADLALVDNEGAHALHMGSHMGHVEIVR